MRQGISTAFLLFTGLIAGCKKSGSSVSGGGLGGSAVLLITPEHHGQFVDSCIVYIKYGTNDAPANGIYDDSTSCILEDTTPVAIFHNLTIGLYYVYGIGYHSTYTPPYIKGGVPVTISAEDTNTVFLPTYSYDP